MNGNEFLGYTAGLAALGVGVGFCFGWGLHHSKSAPKCDEVISTCIAKSWKLPTSHFKVEAACRQSYLVTKDCAVLFSSGPYKQTCFTMNASLVDGVLTQNDLRVEDVNTCSYYGS